MSHPLRKQPSRRATFTRSAFRSLVSVSVSTGGLLALAQSTLADTLWTAGTANWNVAGNWSNGLPDTGNQNAVVNNGGTVLITQNQTANDVNGGTVANANTASNYLMSAGTLTINGWFRYGTVTGATAAFNLNGGIVNMNVSASQLNLGEAAGGTGTLNIGGGTFNFGSTGVLSVGRNGVGNFNITSGVFNNNSTVGYASIGNASGSVGIMSVSGGSYVTTADALNVSDNSGATGTLNVSGTGAVTLNGNILYVGKNTSATGTVNLGNGTTYDGTTTTATIKTTQILGGAGTGTVNFNGGRLVENNGATAINLLGATAITRANVGNGGAVIESNNTGGTTVSQPLLHTNVVGQNATDGGLIKLGTSLLILTGANTYNGPTTINSGTLQIGAGGTVGTLGTSAADIVDNGTLAFNRTDTVTLANNITGSGSLSQAGSGTLSVTGANTYAGNTLISAGFLRAATPGALPGYNVSGKVQVSGSGRIAVASGAWTSANIDTLRANATFATNAAGFAIDTAAGDFTYASDIGGALGFTKLGANQLTFSGNNTYTGATNVNAGTLLISGGNLAGATVSPSIVVNNTGTGTATLTQTGGTVSGGTGEVWIGNGAGSTGIYNISNGSLTVNNWLAIGRSGASGTINQTGGTITKTNTANNITLVNNATWNQTGGALNITGGALWIGEAGPATYNISGGTITGLGIEVDRGGTANAAVLNLQSATDTTPGLTNGGGTEVVTGTTLTMGTGGTGTSLINLNGGTLSLNNIVIGTSTGTKTINYNGGLLQARTATATFLPATGIANNVLVGGFKFDTNGNAITIPAVLAHGSGATVDGGLTKSGANSLTLTAANTYNGPTIVTGGTLVSGLAASFPTNTALTNTGATVNFNGKYLVTAGGPAALTLGGLTTTSGTFNFNFSANQGDSIAITNAASVTGGKISITATGTSLTPGTYNLFSDAAGGLTNFTLTGVAASGALNVNGTVYPLTLNATDMVDQLIIGPGQLGTLYYTGSQNNTLNYLVGGLSNFSSDAAGATNAATIPTQFTDVVFTASANTNPANFATDLGGNVSLNSLIFNANAGAPISINDSTNGTFTLSIYGLTGGVAGTGISLLAGAPAVTISANVALAGSQIWTNVSTSLLTVSGSINANNNSLTLSGSGAQTLSGTITNLNSLTSSATGTILVSGNDTVNGAVTATAGTLTLSGNDTIGGAVNSNGGALTLSGTNSITGAVNVTAGSLNLSGANTIGGSVNATGGTLTLAGGDSITGAVNVTSALATFGGTNTIGGAININTGGVVNFATAGSLGTGNAINLGGGGNLQYGVGNTTDVTTNHALNFNGAGAIDTNGNNVTIAGAFTGTGGGAITKLGAGTLTLTGGLNLTAVPTNLFVRFGTLTLTGANEAINTNNYGSVGQNTGDRGTLNVLNGARYTTTSDLNLGDSASGLLSTVNGGIINLSGASSVITANQFFVGKGTSTTQQFGYGVFNQSSGTFTSAGNSQVGGFGLGQYNLNGGVWNHTGGFISVARQPGSFGVIDINGGTLNDTAPANRTIIGEQGTGILNVRNGGVLNNATAGNTGAGNLTTALAALTLGNGGGSGTGIANLLAGGTISTTSIGGLNNATTGIFNFNGGLLTTRSSTTTFIQNLTGAYVYGGGAFIDTTAGDATIAQPLLAPNGAGVGSITLAGSGFATTPFVQITGGGGVGATAVATVDGSGTLTGFTITNPGTGYTSAPTVTVTGPFGTQVIGTATLNAGNVSGGLTKLGTGVLTLAATETYTGDTTISAGTLQLGNGTTNGVIASANVFDSGALIINPGTAQTFTAPISGTGSFTKLGAGTLTLTSTNSYAGVTTLGGGILSAADLENGGINSTIGSSSAAPGNLVFAGGSLLYTGPSITIDRGYTMGTGGGGIDNANNLTITGQILGTGAGAFTKNGAGTLVYTNVTGTNTLSGPGTTGFGYVVNNGLVQFGGTPGAPLAQTNVVNGEVTVGTINTATSPNAALEFNGGNTTITSYLGAGRGNGTNNAATSITFNNNAVVTSTNFSLGYDNGVSGYKSSPTVTLNGTSSYTDNGLFRLGESVNATGGVSTFNVNGNATFAQTGNGNTVTIGQSASAIFNQNGGSVTFAAPIQFGSVATGSGVYNLNAGTFNVASINKGAGAGAVNFGGGTLIATASDNPGTGAGTSTFLTGVTGNVGNASAIIDTNGFTVTASSALVPAGGTGTGGLTKNGLGRLNLTANNTYTGATLINNGTVNVDNGSTTPLTTAGNLSGTSAITVNNGGTLLLSGANSVNNRVSDTAPVTLNGGTLALAGVAEGTGNAGSLAPAVSPALPAPGVGALTLFANSSIDLQGTSLVHFAASGGNTWTGNLAIFNYSGTPQTGGAPEQLLFGTDDSATSLTNTQLGQISFYSGPDTSNFLGTAGFAGLGDGEIVPVPVPEPATWLAGALTLGLLGFSQRRRVSAWLGLSRAA